MLSRFLTLLILLAFSSTLHAQTPSFKMPRSNKTYGAVRNKAAISLHDAAEINTAEPKKGDMPALDEDDVTNITILHDEPIKQDKTEVKVKEDKASVKESEHSLKDKANTAQKAAIAQKKAENEFKTPEIIEYKYQERTRLTKLQKLESLRSALYENAAGSDLKKQFAKDTVAKKLKSIKQLEHEIGQLNDQTDSLFYLYTKDYMQYKNATVLSFGALRSRAFFDMLYGNEGKQFKALGNAGINFGNNSASIYSELVSGNLSVFRISLGTMITSSNGKNPLISKQEEAYQRLVTYGGNTVLTAEYPLAYIHSNDNSVNFISRLIAKGSSDLPVFGTNTESWAGSGSLGTDFYADAATGNRAIRFFANVNASANYGTEIFQRNLGISSPYFGFGQASLGLVFLENFKISFIVYTFSTEEALRNRNVVAGGQILR